MRNMSSKVCVLGSVTLLMGAVGCPAGQLDEDVSGTRLTVRSGETVVLDATDLLASEPEPIDYRWRQLDGPSVELPAGSVPRAEFVAPEVSEPTSLPIKLTAAASQLDASVLFTVTVLPRGASVGDAGSEPDAGTADSGPGASEDARVGDDAGASDPDAGSGDGGSERPPEPVGDGIWISPEELSDLPTSGEAWEAVESDAHRDGTADVSDQDSQHDTYTLAAALYCARTGERCAHAEAELLEAIGTELGGDWLALSRNLGAYTVAADVLGLRADGDASSAGTRVEQWLSSFMTRTDIPCNGGESCGTRGIVPFKSGSNASAQEGFVHAAIAAYLGEAAALDRAWDAFRTYACDPTAPDHEDINIDKGIEYGWAHEDDQACAVNPAGTTKVVPGGLPGAGTEHRIDGAIINDVRRGGEYQWPPGYSHYPWVGLEGFVPAAVILDRAGYPAFEVADEAVRRTVEYLWWLGGELGEPRACTSDCWWDHDRATDVKHLVNWRYGTAYSYEAPVGASRTMGYTDWTHR